MTQFQQNLREILWITHNPPQFKIVLYLPSKYKQLLRINLTGWQWALNSLRNINLCNKCCIADMSKLIIFWKNHQKPIYNCNFWPNCGHTVILWKTHSLAWLFSDYTAICISPNLLIHISIFHFTTWLSEPLQMFKKTVTWQNGLGSKNMMDAWGILFKIPSRNSILARKKGFLQHLPYLNMQKLKKIS